MRDHLQPLIGPQPAQGMIARQQAGPVHLPMLLEPVDQLPPILAFNDSLYQRSTRRRRILINSPNKIAPGNPSTSKYWHGWRHNIQGQTQEGLCWYLTEALK